MYLADNESRDDFLLIQIDHQNEVMLLNGE